MDDLQREKCIEKFLNREQLGKRCADWLTDLSQRLTRLRFPGHINREEVEDIAQDSLIKAWRNSNQFLRKSRFEGWLEGIVRNTGLMHFRDVRRSPVTVSTEDLAVPVEPSTHDTTQDQVVTRSLIAEVNLTAEEEAIFALITNGAGEHKAIAAQLGIGENAVKMGFRRARNKMKKLFDVVLEGTTDE